MTDFYPKWDYTIPEQNKGSVTGEAHTIPSASPFVIYLRHIPKEDVASTVAIPGYTEVSSSPSAGEFLVHYGPTGFGQIEFNSADANDAITVDYVIAGTVIWAETYDGGNREGVNHLQDIIDGKVAKAGDEMSGDLIWANAVGPRGTQTDANEVNLARVETDDAINFGDADALARVFSLTDPTAHVGGNPGETLWHGGNFPLNNQQGGAAGDVLTWSGTVWEPQTPIDHGWQVIARLEDTNTGTALNIDTGVLATTFDMYKIIVATEERANADTNVSCRINGLTGAQYFYLEYNNNGLARVASATFWNLYEMQNLQTGIGTFYLSGKPFLRSSFIPQIHGTAEPGSTLNDALLRGNYDVSVSEIDRIHLFTSANATGRMVVLGMNLS